MKKIMTLLMIIALLGVPMVALAEETESWDKALARHSEEFGKNFFSYAHGLFNFPLQMTEKATRTLLFMDRE